LVIPLHEEEIEWRKGRMELELELELELGLVIWKWNWVIGKGGWGV